MTATPGTEHAFYLLQAAIWLCRVPTSSSLHPPECPWWFDRMRGMRMGWMRVGRFVMVVVLVVAMVMVITIMPVLVFLTSAMFHIVVAQKYFPPCFEIILRTAEGIPENNVE